MIDPYPLIVDVIQRELVPRLPGVDFFYPNDGRLDVTSQYRPFVYVDIRIDDSYQASLEDNPLIQRHGDVVFYAYEKSGSGTASVRAALAECVKTFELLTWAGIQFTTADQEVSATRPGWYGQARLVPFYYQETRS